MLNVYFRFKIVYLLTFVRINSHISRRMIYFYSNESGAKYKRKHVFLRIMFLVMSETTRQWSSRVVHSRIRIANRSHTKNVFKLCHAWIHTLFSVEWRTNISHKKIIVPTSHSQTRWDGAVTLLRRSGYACWCPLRHIYRLFEKYERSYWNFILIKNLFNRITLFSELNMLHLPQSLPNSILKLKSFNGTRESCK